MRSICRPEKTWDTARRPDARSAGALPRPRVEPATNPRRRRKPRSPWRCQVAGAAASRAARFGQQRESSGTAAVRRRAISFGVLLLAYTARSKELDRRRAETIGYFDRHFDST